MCDKDHFAESVAEYEARGLVTRRQFGVILAAGAVMALPQLANAQTTSERDVTIKTPDGTCGSMTGERMAAATRAADALGRSLQPGDQWSISTFDSTRRTMITWRPYNPGIVNSLRAMPTSGSTELFRAVTEMVPYMKETPHRKRAMLLMTDGIDNSIIAASRDGRGDPFEAPGPLESSAKAQAALREGEVLLYALGINVAGRAGAVHVPSLQRLAEPTGGSVIIASTIREVEAAAQRVAEELRQQYTLGFYPQNAGGKTYHRLRVVTRHPDHRVRTRAGYLTATPK